jgi:hypothetical protein
LGLIGLALFLVCLALVLRDAIRLPRWEAWLGLTWLAVWTLGASTLTWEHRKPTWIVMSFITSLAVAGMNRADPSLANRKATTSCDAGSRNRDRESEIL